MEVLSILAASWAGSKMVATGAGLLGSLEGQGISFPGASFMLQASYFKQTSLHSPSVGMVGHKPIPTSITGRGRGSPWLVQTTQDLPWIWGSHSSPWSYKIGV